MTSLPLANKIISEVGIDVVDKEEDAYKAILALEWTEPINLPQYMPLLTQLANVEAPYLFHESDMVVDSADIYGLVYQGYEWLGPILRKDKVDVSNYADWTDLARDEMVGKGIDYAFNDNRGCLSSSASSTHSFSRALSRAISGRRKPGKPVLPGGKITWKIRSALLATSATTQPSS